MAIGYLDTWHIDEGGHHIVFAAAPSR